MQGGPPRPEAGEQRGTWFENAAFSGWQPARELRARPPSPDAESLRAAYLDVLKLCLCGLGGTSTTSVWRDTHGSVMSRELKGADLQIRALGVDWPLQGLTMIGLNRLDDLQSCVEAVVREGIEGDLIEAGTWRGGASILMRATLNALGAAERCVWVADSFEGFPAPKDHPGTKELAVVGFLAVPLDDVKASFARFGCQDGVRFVPGFFEETMPGLTDQRWSVVRLDGDSYEATWMTLQSLYPDLSVGGYLIVDDYGALEECQQAVDGFRRHHGITEPLEQVDWTCVRWRRRSAAPIENADAPGGREKTNGRSSARRFTPARETRVPTVDELAIQREKSELDRELTELRGRLAAAEAEIDLLHGSPLRGPRAWLRRRLSRDQST